MLGEPDHRLQTCDAEQFRLRANEVADLSITEGGYMPEVRSVFFSRNHESEVHLASNGLEREFDRLATEISTWRCQEATALFQVGSTLIEAKSKLPRGHWLAFLQDRRVGYKPRLAQLLMNIARASDGESLVRFGIAKATELLRIDASERNRLLAEHDVALISVPELRRLIGSLGGAHEKQTAGAGGPKTERTFGVWGGLKPDLAWGLGVLHLRVHELSQLSVDAAYRELAKILHSDHGKTRDDRFMQDLNEARRCLQKHIQSASAA
jgi:hypothetical protein